MRERGKKLVLILVCRFGFGAGRLLSNQQMGAFFFRLAAHRHLHAQFSRVILGFGVKARIFVGDCDVVSQSCRETFVGFAEVIRATPIKQIKPPKDYTARKNWCPQEGFNWVEVIVDQ